MCGFPQWSPPRGCGGAGRPGPSCRRGDRVDTVEEGLSRMRRRYTAGRLLERDLAADPFDEFRAWLHDAVTMGIAEPNAMVLGTVGPDGRPSSRSVLLKGIDDGAFVFFTNTGSRKAAEIGANPGVSLCFPWIAMERQVLVCGAASRASRAAT